MTSTQPSRVPGGDRHTEIDDAARQIAFTSGLSAITLRRLASTVGVDPGLIALHEPSMGALVARTFDELASSELAQTDKELQAAATPLDALRDLTESLLDESHHNFNSIWADAWSLGRRNTQLARAARESMAAWTATVRRIIADGIAARQFNDTDPELVAMQFFALIDSTTAYSLVDHLTAESRAGLVRRTLEISLGLPEGTL